MKAVALLLVIGLVYNSVNAQGSNIQNQPGAPEQDIPQDNGPPQQEGFSEDEAPDYPIFESDFSYSEAYYDEPTMVMLECPELSDCATFSERVASWLCDYTNYKLEAMTWKARFEEWWSSCDESASTKSVWESSFDCVDTSMVKCVNEDKRTCDDLGMDCPVCVCKDGHYQDPRQLYRLWRSETTMFRERLEIYKTKVESCTRSGNVSPGCATATTPTTDSPTTTADYSGSGSGFDVGSGMGSGDVSGSGSGSGSGEEEQTDGDLDVHI